MKNLKSIQQVSFAVKHFEMGNAGAERKVMELDFR